MSDVQKNLDVIIGAKDEASGVFASAFEKLKSQAKEMNAEARQSGDTALERMLKGGGALGIVTLLGEGLKKVTGEAVKLSNEFEEGKINAADMALEIGKSVPVLGGFVEAGESINELFTHQKRDIADINEEIKASNDAMELRVKIQKESIKAEEELADRIRKAKEAQDLANASGPGGDKHTAEGSNKLKDIKADQEKDAKEFADKRKEDLEKQIEGIRKVGEALKKEKEDAAGFSLSDLKTNDSPDEIADKIEIRKRTATFEAEQATQRTIDAVKKQAQADIDKHNSGLATLAATQRATVITEAANERFKEEGEKVKKFFEDAAHDAREAIEKHQHAEKTDDHEQKEADRKRLEDQRKEELRLDEEANHHVEIQHALAQGKIELLEREARLGDVAAAREAEQLRIAEEYLKKKEEIFKLSKGASDEDRAAIAEQAHQLDTEQQHAQFLSELKPQLDALNEPKRYADFEDFSKTHGIMDAQRERDRSSSKDQIAHLSNISKTLDNLDKKIPQIPENAFVGGNSDTWDSELT